MQYLGAGQEGRGEKVRGLKQHVKKLCDFSLGRGAYERDIVKTYTGYRCRPFLLVAPVAADTHWPLVKILCFASCRPTILLLNHYLIHFDFWHAEAF